jgi:hypothetical protein
VVKILSRIAVSKEETNIMAENKDNKDSITLNEIILTFRSLKNKFTRPRE